MPNLPKSPYGTIYLLTCIANGKCYVGQTVRTVHARWKSHCSATSSRKVQLIGLAIRKHGPEMFSVSVLDTAANQGELDSKEVYWIAHLNTMRPHGYNLSGGGHGAGVMAPETKEKIRQAAIGRKASDETREKLRHAQSHRSEETREKIRQANLGRTYTLETRQKMSVSQTGRRHTDESKEKISRSHMGMGHTPETKKKLSEINKGKVLSPEHREAIIRANTGKVPTAEHREKISKALTGITRTPETKERCRIAALARQAKRRGQTEPR